MTFKEIYKKEILPNLKKELNIKNYMELPKLEKIVLNIWIGTFMKSSGKNYSDLQNDLSLIAWQKSVVKNAKKAISNFKIKEWMPVWLMVTLRWDKMFYFLEKLIHIICPRIRDFRWLSIKSFDKEWNYNFWIKEHVVFPEVPTHDVVKPHGLQITIKIKNINTDHSIALLKAMWFPFYKN